MSSSAEGSVHVVNHRDFPHLSEVEWEACARLSSTIGEQAVLHLLELPHEEQRKALRKFISSLGRTNGSSTNMHVSETKIKIDAGIYHGRLDESLPQWIVEVEAVFRARRIIERDMQVAYGMSRLAGKARSWAFSKQMQSLTCFPNWEALKNELTETFQPPQSEYRLRMQFLRIAQNKQTMHEYVQSTRNLVSSFVNHPVDEITKVAVFLMGLRDGPIRKELFRVFPTTLEEAIKIALREDFSLSQSKENRATSVAPVVNFDNRDGCTPMDLSVAEVQRKQITDIVCFRCQKKGHVMRDCGMYARKQHTGRGSGPRKYHSKKNDQRIARTKNLDPR